jgi:hypothetical protein
MIETYCKSMAERPRINEPTAPAVTKHRVFAITVME